MATATDLMTIEEYLALPDDGRRTELVEGRIVELTRPGFERGDVSGLVYFYLKLAVRQQGSGKVISNDSGIITQRDPDILRGADVAYYSAAKVPPLGRRKGYPDALPDLVVGVRSPSDRWRELLAKAAEYLRAGVLVVLLVDPETRTAHVVTDDALQTFGPSDELIFPDLLPDFRVRVEAFFED